MSSEILSALEIDAIGEILNISLGSSATAISNLLGTRVDITTPVVKVVTKEEFEMGRIEPAVGVELNECGDYLRGRSGGKQCYASQAPRCEGYRGNDDGL